MGPDKTPSDDAKLAATVKVVKDIDDLVRMTLRALPRAKPWQRQWAARLSEVDRAVEVLRLTIALEKSDADILVAAEDVTTACRRVAASLAGSRADFAAMRAARLVNDLGETLRTAFAALR